MHSFLVKRSLKKLRKYRDILILGKCNLSCWYCERPNYHINEDKVLLSMKKVVEIFNKEEVAFRFECRGEITLYQKVMNFIVNLAEEGYRVEILTNGILLQKVLLKEAQVGVNISLDGHTPQMNIHRGLNEEQINLILENIIKYNANIQMVYYEQTIREVNEFIELLHDIGFKKNLYIFPCIIGGKMISHPISYDELNKKEFIQTKEYFTRWEYIHKNKCRKDFICDFTKNGYVYYIYNSFVKMTKCDGNPLGVINLQGLSYETEDSEFSCGCCINHCEFNNERDFLND